MAGKEEIWDLDKVAAVAAVGLAGVRGRCTRQHAQNVKKNVKFLLNPAETVRYTARTAFQSAEIVTVNKGVRYLE